MTTEAQKAACRRYYERTKGKTRCYLIRLLKDGDADVIAALDAAPNKAEYIRKLVREGGNGQG